MSEDRKRGPHPNDHQPATPQCDTPHAEMIVTRQRREPGALCESAAIC